MKTHTHLMAVAVVIACKAALANPDLSLLLENAQSLSLQYYKHTPDGEVFFWNVEFSGSEVRASEDALSKAARYHHEGLLLATRMYKGTFVTSEKKFRVFIGIEKRADYIVFIGLREKGPPRSKVTYKLLGDDASAFWSLLTAALEDRTQGVAPDRIRKYYRDKEPASK